jgi:general stress protein CsbA
VLLASPMCGYSNSNWIFSLTSVLVFAGLIVASVIFLVRWFNQKPEKTDDEKS